MKAAAAAAAAAVAVSAHSIDRQIGASDLIESGLSSAALHGEQWRCHRPYPGRESRRYQVEEARELLERAGVKL